MHKLLVAKTNSLCASKRTSQIAHPTQIPCRIEVNFTPGRIRVNNITEIRHTPLAAATREKILTWIALKFDVGLWNINAECQQSWERWGGHQVYPRHISIFNLLRIPTWYTRHEALIVSCAAWGTLEGRGGGDQVCPCHISIFISSLFSSRSQYGQRGIRLL